MAKKAKRQPEYIANAPLVRVRDVSGAPAPPRLGEGRDDAAYLASRLLPSWQGWVFDSRRIPLDEASVTQFMDTGEQAVTGVAVEG